MMFNVVALFGILQLYHLSFHVINIIEGMKQLLLGVKWQCTQLPINRSNIVSTSIMNYAEIKKFLQEM